MNIKEYQDFLRGPGDKKAPFAIVQELEGPIRKCRRIYYDRTLFVAIYTLVARQRNGRQKGLDEGRTHKIVNTFVFPSPVKNDQIIFWSGLPAALNDK